MRRTLLSGFGALILVLFGAFLYMSMDSKSATFTSSHTGISFKYPVTYHLEEKNIGTTERARYVVVLMKDTPENRAVREGTAPPREGPVTVTIDAFQNNLDSYTAESWIRNTNDSNFKLSPTGTITKEAVGDQEALKYAWSGLYEGTTYVVARPDWVFALSVTYMGSEDEILAVFEEVLKTLRFK